MTRWLTAVATVIVAVTTVFVSVDARSAATVKIGLLKFGTVNWEIDTIARYGLDKANGVNLEVVTLASNEATRIALMSGAVDVIVSDWLFVSRQRAEGIPLTFVPYSTSVGAILVPPDSEIRTLADLKGKTIGVAGGPLDKSWLMLRGMAKGEAGFDLADEMTLVFGAPPLLAEKLRQGELDASLNYWHYNARLEAEGYRVLVTAQDAAAALGAKGDISAIGYVFNEKWAESHTNDVLGFIQASRDAKRLLKESDAPWIKLRSVMQADEETVFRTLVDRYREGIPVRKLSEEQSDTSVIYDYLAGVGGETLVGKATTMAPGTFWSVLKNGS